MLPGATRFTIHSRDDFRHLPNASLRVISPRSTPLSGTRCAFSRAPWSGLSPLFHLQLSVAHAFFKHGLDFWGYSGFKPGLIQKPALAPDERVSPHRAPRERDFPETLAGFRIPAGWAGSREKARAAKNGGFGVASHELVCQLVGRRAQGADARRFAPWFNQSCALRSL